MKHVKIGLTRPQKTKRPLKSSMGLFVVILLLCSGSTRTQPNQEDIMHHRVEVIEALTLISQNIGKGMEKLTYLSEFDVALEKIYQP